MSKKIKAELTDDGHLTVSGSLGDIIDSMDAGDDPNLIPDDCNPADALFAIFGLKRVKDIEGSSDE